MFALQPDLSPTQYRIEDERQLLRPNELEVGMHIAIFVIEGIATSERVRRSLKILKEFGLGEARRQDFWRLSRPWEIASPENILIVPEKSGEIEDFNDNGLGLRLDNGSGHSFSSHCSVGLAPYGGTPATKWMKEESSSHEVLAGRWVPRAVLKLDNQSV